MGSNQHRTTRTPARVSAFFTDWATHATSATASTDTQAADAPDLRPIQPTERELRRRTRAKRVAAAALIAAAAASVIAPITTASADPSAHTWYRLRMCESSDNYSTDTGNGHYGAYQFDLATWRSVGGSGYPSRASKAEQDKRALILYRERGWQPWQCASILGLRNDSDARSGRTSDITVSKTERTSAKGVPAFPGGSHWYTYGEWNSKIKQFQDEMHRRGYFPVGTGQYGSNTLAMVKQLQRLNGLVPNGLIGPNTWRMAWKGTYHPAAKARTATPAATSVPAFPGGSHWYFYGDRSAKIKQFQDEMHRRGYFPIGTGQYGWNTWGMVTRLQKQNGLVPNGLIGPNTWRLAWTGKYHT